MTNDHRGSGRGFACPLPLWSIPSLTYQRHRQGKGRWELALTSTLFQSFFWLVRRVNSAIRERGLRRSAARNYSAPWSRIAPLTRLLFRTRLPARPRRRFVASVPCLRRFRGIPHHLVQAVSAALRLPGTHQRPDAVSKLLNCRSISAACACSSLRLVARPSLVNLRV